MCSPRHRRASDGSCRLRNTTLPSITIFDSGVAISGSGGFIGSHLAAALGAGAPCRAYEIDVSDKAALQTISVSEHAHTLVHMASAGSVLARLESIPRMVDVSVRGLVTAIDVFQPRRVLFSSSCSVYGNTPDEGAPPDSSCLRPLSVYGLSKVLTEKTLEQWVRQTGSEAVVLRISNAIGAGCKGLISYLVRHAVRHPEGDVPAQMRGGGKIVRDYVPVDYIVEVVRSVLRRPAQDGSVSVFNVGSGCLMSNGEVADMVTQWLATQGYRLQVRYAPDPDPCEAAYCRLETQRTERSLELTPPSPQEVRDAILSGAHSLLKSLEADKGSFARVAS